MEQKKREKEELEFLQAESYDAARPTETLNDYAIMRTRMLGKINLAGTRMAFQD